MPPLLQDVFALSGIIAASRVTLQRYLAIASHRPSDQWVPREDEPGPSDANDLAEGTTPKTAFIITLIGAVAFPVLRLVIWLVADYAPVGLALVFFTLLLYLMHVGMVYMTTYVVYPGNPSLAIRRRQADMQFKVRVIGTDPYERLRVPIGFAFPAMVYALADTIVGPVLIPTLAFAWMAALVAMSTAERERGMGVKAVMALNGGLLMLFAACYIWALTESDPPSEPEDKKEPLKFPDWLLKLCMPMLDNCLTCVPAILIAITYRFEYTSLYPPLRSSTDPVPLPALRDTWDLPMTYSGLLGMAISIFGQHLVPKEYQILEHGFSMAAVVVIAPCTMLAVVLVAWRKGLFGEWWEYYEIWTPNIDEVRVMPMLLAEDVTAK